MAPSSVESLSGQSVAAPAKLPSPTGSSSIDSGLSTLRGVRWRVCLGILPSSSRCSIEEFRRVTADCRRKYAILRRRLLVDPLLSKDGTKSPDLVIDNPLSQNPDSMWGCFFRNAELEKMLDQDLSRLYPEHGNYFQTPACQAMLRRILLLWCLRHPECGYRQGMHELLAPLLYVLHFDVQHLCDVRKKYEDYFTDEFDETSFPESDVVSNYRFSKNASWGDTNDHLQGTTNKVTTLDELEPDTRNIILLSDAYGAEGELGIVLSERFLEHDAYCMFDALMGGANGVVALSEFFSHSPAVGSSICVPPVIEASSALYHLLSIVDSSLHSHLVDLGVEPQYFGLRWLRVLFGREFSLKNLLVVWDEVFSSSNNKYQVNIENNLHPNFRVLTSPRGQFISSMAVSMILHLRSSLFATENATSCLQKLLNFPENIDVMKLIGKAKSLQDLVFYSNESVSKSQVILSRPMPHIIRGDSLSIRSASPKTPIHPLPESYWEEKWRVLHKAEELKKGHQSDPVSHIIPKGSMRERFTLSRTESDPSPAKSANERKDSHSSVRRKLFDDLSQVAKSEADGESRCDEHSCADTSGKHYTHINGKNILGKNIDYGKAEDTCINGNIESVLCTTSSHLSGNHDHDSELEKSSVRSGSSSSYLDAEIKDLEIPYDTQIPVVLEISSTMPADIAKSETDTDLTEKQEIALGASISNSLPIADLTEKKEISMPSTDTILETDTDLIKKPETISHEKKVLPNKFQWFWKFGRGGTEGNVEKGMDTKKIGSLKNSSKNTLQFPSQDGCGASGRVETGDKRVMGTFRSLGQSMLENIQVIESAIQQEMGQAGVLENFSNNILGGKRQTTAVVALKELRKISNILSEM